MAGHFLCKVINSEISSLSVIKWLQNNISENDEDYDKIVREDVTCVDFVTYFINFVHEIPRDISQLLNYKKDSLQGAANLSNDEISINEDSKYNSTPKANLNKSIQKSRHFSPISPLYQPKTNSYNNTRKSSDKLFSLGDFLPNNFQNVKKKRSTTELPSKKKELRRIKPTSINIKESNNGFQSKENSFNFQSNHSEVVVNNTIEQRKLLIEEKDKILLKCDTDKSVSPLIKRPNGVKEKVTPTLGNVTYRKEIENIVEIYKYVLSSKFIINVTSEIYFLLSLLLTQHIDNKKCTSFCQIDQSLGIHLLDNAGEKPPEFQVQTCRSYLFESVHNIVYFAGNCLQSQIQIIKYYDKSTLQLLGNNKCIQQFFPHFSKRILFIADKKIEKAYNEIINPTIPNNVCFNIDTDNKDNFSNIQSFHAFRKQRDLFYEILRIWENNHLLPGWNYSSRLTGKILTLFSLSTEPICYIHFARLFKNQLLTNCSKGPNEKGLSKNNLLLLPSLPIDKLNQLTNRLVTKESSNGINSLPEFTGYQEFYKDFIVVASNHSFNKHLCDNLISEIIELNNASFLENGLENEKDVDVNTRKQYVSYIKNLRILAKFLGYIESIPYKSCSANLSQQAMDIQIKVRCQGIPVFDVKRLLETAMSKKSLILIVPWLTKYLSMLDRVTLRLPYYSSLNMLLFNIYTSLAFTYEFDYNAAVIKFCLGWLFQLPHFPTEQYFKFCSENLNGVAVLNGNSLKKEHTTLDDLNIISQSMLYVCCPYLEEIKKVLASTALDDKMPIKYITPVTATDSKIEASRKKIQNQLEEAFFNSHPISVRKTVEFVSERVASIIVKYICYDKIVTTKSDVVRQFRENVLKQEYMEKGEYNTDQKKCLQSKAVTFAQTSLQHFKGICEDEAMTIAKEKITSSIENLLPLDTLVEMKEVCVDFTIKMCMERVKQWLATHLTSTVFEKDLESDIQKFLSGKKTDKISPLLPVGGKTCKHSEEELSSVTIMGDIKDLCCDLIENKDKSLEDILSLLKRIYSSLTGRNDINDQMAFAIRTSLFDLCLILVSRRSSVFKKNETLEDFGNIWKLQSPNQNTIFNNLFCPRNIRMIKDSADTDSSWKCYANLVSYLVKEGLLDEKDLEFQCTNFYNRDWDEVTLACFSTFLKEFLNCNKSNSANSTFGVLLEFLSDYCLDLHL